MLYSWNEINDCFERIKNHKPRATKKLKELGEILSSAYLLDAVKANEMWQYIIDLNLADDVSYSKFYISQVYNSLLNFLKYEEAAELLSMNKDRFALALKYGCRIDDLTYSVIGYNVIQEQYDEALNNIFLVKQHFEANSEDDDSFYCWLANIFTHFVSTPYSEELASKIYTFNETSIITLLDRCLLAFSEDDVLYSVLFARKSVYCGLICCEHDFVIRSIYNVILAEYKVRNKNYLILPHFLYLERKIITEDEMSDVVAEYCDSCLSINLPCSKYDEEYMRDWIINILEKSEKALNAFFTKGDCATQTRILLDKWIQENKFNLFIKYFSLAIVRNDKGYNLSSYIAYLREKIDNYLLIKNNEVYFQDQQWWLRVSEFSSRGVSAEQLMINKDNLNTFIDALSKICIMTSASSANEEIISIANNFISRETGSIVSLQTLGLAVEEDFRTEIAMLSDYSEELLAHIGLSDCIDNEELDQRILRVQKETKLYGNDLGAYLAEYPCIIKLLFLYTKNMARIKSNIILGTLLDNSVEISLHCVDYIIQTAQFENYSVQPSWEDEAKDVVYDVLNSIIQNNINSYQELQIPQNVIKKSIKIAKSVYPYLSLYNQKIIEPLIMSLEKKGEISEGFIKSCYEDIDDYITNNGHKKKQNRYYSFKHIVDFLRALLLNNRIDIAGELLREMVDRKIKPNELVRIVMLLSFSNDQYQSLYLAVPELFYYYVDSVDKRDAMEMLKKFGDIGNYSIYSNLKHYYVERFGMAEELCSCFNFENIAKPLSIIKYRNFEVDFLYWVNKSSYFGGTVELYVYFSIKNELCNGFSGKIHSVKINDEKIEDIFEFEHWYEDKKYCVELPSFSKSKKSQPFDFYVYLKPNISPIKQMTFSFDVMDKDDNSVFTKNIRIKYDITNDTFVLS